MNVAAANAIPSTTVESGDDRWSVYDEPEFESYLATDAGEASLAVAVEGMHCASCAWRIEQCLAGVAGVTDFDVNLTSRRVDVRWDTARTQLSGVLGAIAELGFEPRPIHLDREREIERQQARGLLMRFAVATVFGMQVMMLALAGYLDVSAEFGADLGWFFALASLVLTLPVIGFSAQPFFRSAINALGARRVNMDVPISLALVLAFGGSCINVVRASEPIYFDSVAMFVIFLLGSRYLEMRARVAAASGLDSLASLIPTQSMRIVNQVRGQAVLERVPTARLAPGDNIRVSVDEVIPADGVIVAGYSSVDESILSGESEPCRRGPEQEVSAGSVNLEAPLDIRVTATGERSFVGHIQHLVQRAAGSRGNLDEFGTRIAGWFIAGVLTVAAATAVIWSLIEPGKAFAATLAVLVAACPCALALARPAALSAAHAALLSRRIAVVGRHALERLSSINSAWFDKTGTLTEGRSRVVAMEQFNCAAQDQVVAVARALAQASRHPVAIALRAYTQTVTPAALDEIVVRPGYGVSGQLGGQTCLLGSRRMLEEEGHHSLPSVGSYRDGGGKEVWLSIGDRVAARFEMSDPPRPGVEQVTCALRARKLHTSILSGDRPAAVEALATVAGIEHWHAACSPAEKLEHLSQAREQGRHVLMVGDGANDSPVLAAADVAVAVGNATPAAAQQADILLLNNDLQGVIAVFDCARQLRRIVRQNMGWAIAYNLSAVPLAATGMLPPWAAAIGMSASSLLVVLNALRVRPPAE